MQFIPQKALHITNRQDYIISHYIIHETAYENVKFAKYLDLKTAKNLSWNFLLEDHL